MSEKDTTPSTEKDKEDKKGSTTIVIDRSAEMESLQTRLKTIEEEARKTKEEKVALEAAKTQLETEKKAKEEEAEDLKSQLEIIAEKEFTKERNLILDRAKTDFGAENPRYKEIEAKLTDPEKGPDNLKETKYMLDILEESMRKGAEAQAALKKLDEDKARAEAASAGQPIPPTGSTVGLTEQQTGGQDAGYESYEAMIRDLRIRSRDPKDPVKQAVAQSVLDELFKKWCIAIKKDYKLKEKIDYEAEKQKTLSKMKTEGA